MRLTFELQGHREFSFQVVVRDETTLSQLKRMLSEVTMLAAESHTLHFNGVEMKHEELEHEEIELRAYEIHDEATLQLMLHLQDFMLPMALYVIQSRIAALHQLRLTVIPSHSDAKITFTVKAMEHVLTLEEKLRKLEASLNHLNRHGCYFVHDGNVLEPGATFLAQNVADGAVVRVLASGLRRRLSPHFAVFKALGRWRVMCLISLVLSVFGFILFGARV